MKFKFFAIPALNPAASEAELNMFCARHKIDNIETRFAGNGANSFWFVCVTWLEQDAALAVVAWARCLCPRGCKAIDLKRWAEKHCPPYTFYAAWHCGNLSLHPPLEV